MKKVLVVGLIVMLAAPAALASTITAGDHTILNKTGQTVTVTVYGDGSETAAALNFYTSVANGPGGSTALLITNLNFNPYPPTTTGSGFMWDGSNYETEWSGSATKAGGGAGNMLPPWPGALGPITIPGTSESPVGLVEVTFDASSAPFGTWDFDLTGDGTTSWSGGTAGSPTLLSGSVTVTPEPGILVQLLGLAGTGGLGFALRRRRKRQES